MFFVGTHERNLDDKGRVALPAPFRSRLGEHCYLVKGLDRCVSVLPAEVFEAEAAYIDERVKAGEISRNEARALFYSASLGSFDKQGRITIDEQLRTYAGLTLGQSLVVAGARDRLEIWSTDRYARVNTDGTGRLAGNDE